MKKYFLRSLGLFFLLLIGGTLDGSEAQSFQISSGQGTLTLVVRLPDHYEFIHGTPASIEFSSSAPESVSFPAVPAGHFNPLAENSKIPFTAGSGTATITIKAKLYYCSKSTKMCLQGIHETRLTFSVSPQGTASPVFIWNVTPKADRESLGR